MSRRGIYMMAGFVLVVLRATGALAVTVPTAKQALEVANLQIATNAQNQVIMMEGTRSDSSLSPRQWDITFFDTNRVNDGLMVRVKDGAVVNKSGSLRMFDDPRWSRFGRNFAGYYPDEVIKLKRWKLDSDQIVRTAQAHPKLTSLQVTDVVLLLRKSSDGDVPPVWRIKVRARPPQKPSRESWVGYLEYNAETGELLVDELRVEGLTK
jgi:hypothetical protein